ncbi:MAG: folylpolyglutamate synthase/dihydrofolate synthase family protein [Cellulophaga sp.]
MTYKQTLDWMFAQLPMYQAKGKIAFNNKLDTILALSAHLQNPEKKFKSIHVAGTNGKGSSSHMLASILQEAGYTVGLYTSPHLKDFRERIRINGNSVSENFVVDFITSNKIFFEENSLSFFEMTVGMAFDYFAKNNIDIAIIEVGLGGRLDSTNIITPEVSLITNIGLDHTDMLGNTLTQIAKEKAGIIKKKTPVVISETQKEIATVFKEIARDNEVSIVFANETVKETYKTALLGEYQAKNIKGVIATLKELKGFKVEEEHIKNGLLNVVTNTGLMGRWQVLQTAPMAVCDTAHNKEGLSLVMKQLSKQTYNHLHIVLGFVSDKDLDRVLPLFPKNATYYFAKPDIPRGLHAKTLQKEALAYNLNGKTYTSVNKALTEALANSKKEDFVYIGGSTFVVAEVV